MEKIAVVRMERYGTHIVHLRLLAQSLFPNTISTRNTITNPSIPIYVTQIAYSTNCVILFAPIIDLDEAIRKSGTTDDGSKIATVT
ncbi:hypothetical protein HanIR_Chr01g0044601 [Helianthus annuus]|nr:hypothetical protein HanIR_Chr01g0044601 [Helianthus annuus]